MLVLALDTTTRRGSVALARDGALLDTYEGDPQTTHGERLPADLVRVLNAHGLRVADIDVFAVAAGPGSFTGLRIGIAAMQGLALANDKSLVGVSALDAISEVVRAPGEMVAWMDAHRGEVFSAVFRNGAALEDAMAEKPAEILLRWQRDGRRPPLFAGDGALAYKALILEEVAGAAVVEPLPPLAPGIARLAEAYTREHGPSPPDAIRPLYVRRSDAELARDRKADLKAG
jgi:tRNA threonylcarbamoyladenosine biosynthesis protein TsaB